MPQNYTPPGSSRAYEIPDGTDPTVVAQWFRDVADSIDGHLAEHDAALLLKAALTHKTSHQSGGADALLLAQSQVDGLSSALAAKAATVKQATAPTGNAQTIWYDSSTTPPTPKFWDGSAWLPFSSGVSLLTAADITVNSGSPDITTITDSGVGYTIYRWTASGQFTAAKSGLAEVLIIGAGSDRPDSTTLGSGGRVVTGMHLIASGANTITVGARIDVYKSARSLLGTINSGPQSIPFSGYPTGAGGNDAGNRTDGLTSSITGTATVYAPAGDATKYGGGGVPGGTTTGASGAVFLRVRS